MKTYKLNNIEISEESAREFIKNNPELLEKKVSGRYFFPKVGEKYWCFSSTGVFLTQNEYDGGDIDEYNISTGNCYRTKEEAKLAEDKQLAIVRCWKWAQENAPFEPDWSNVDQPKFYVRFDHGKNIFGCDFDYDYQFHSQFTLPYFESAQFRNNFIEANKEDLLLLFTK